MVPQKLQKRRTRSWSPEQARAKARRLTVLADPREAAKKQKQRDRSSLDMVVRELWNVYLAARRK